MPKYKFSAKRQRFNYKLKQKARKVDTPRKEGATSWLFLCMKAVSTTRKSRPMGVVAGIADIFGLCGFFYGWKARRAAK